MQMQKTKCHHTYEFLSKRTSGWGWTIFGVILAACSLWAFALDFRRALGLFVVKCLVASSFSLDFVTDKYVPEQKATLQNIVAVWFAETLEASKIAAAVCAIVIAKLSGFMTDTPRNLISGVGLIVFVVLSWAFSWNPKGVKWRPISSGVFLQFVLGALILRVEVVASAFQW